LQSINESVKTFGLRVIGAQEEEALDPLALAAARLALAAVSLGTADQWKSSPTITVIVP
jgi:hypothetical protein